MGQVGQAQERDGGLLQPMQNRIPLRIREVGPVVLARGVDDVHVLVAEVHGDFHFTGHPLLFRLSFQSLKTP